MPKTGVEPARLSTHAPETCASTNSATWARHGAENEARTRDPNLGKVVLYQLSYFRIESEEEETRTPTPRGTATSKQRVYHSATSPFPITKRWWCPRQESNLHASQHTHLKRARLPIPPLGQDMERKTRLELATPTLARLCSTN